MKKVVRFSCALALTLLWACSDKDDASPKVVTVEDYQQVSVAGDIIVRYKQDESNEDNKHQVHIITQGYQDQLTVSAKNGELRIVGDNIDFNEQVIVEIYPETLESIRLESGQKAIFEGVIIQPDLNIVTEGNSELEIYGLQVNTLEAKLEADSKLVLSSYLESGADSADFLETEAILLDNYSLHFDHQLVKGDSVKLVTVEDHKVWRIYGEEIRYYYYPERVNFRTEGAVTLDALDSPVEDVLINLQGSSEAKVWATQNISGKGEGESALTYKGYPVVNNFILQGGAELIEYQP